MATLTVPAERRDTGILRLALAGAVALHAAALLLPVPRSAPPPIPLSDLPDDPVVRVLIDVPPPPPPAAPVERTVRPDATDRFIPAEMAPPVLRPADPLPTIVDDLPPLPPSASFAMIGPIDSPPEPAVYDQTTAGLVLPVASGDRARPVYPSIARIAGREGRVVLLATIAADGTVGEIEVLAAPTPELGFVQAAIDAVATWRYEPGRLGRRAVAVQMTVVVTFSLN